MIDWITLQIGAEMLSPEVLDRFAADSGRIICVDPDGSVRWEAPTFQTIRSDSHSINCQLGTDLRIYGSPARVNGSRTDNVFGSGVPIECAGAMLEFVATSYGVRLPPIPSWRCTRMDVTHNFYLGDLTNVKTALFHLRSAEGGRYQVRTMAESVYWSVRSSYRSAKAYAKGEHLRYVMGRGAPPVSADELALADGLLRLELSLKRHWFQRLASKPWFQLSEHDIDKEFDAYFSKLIGDVEMIETTDIESRCVAAAERLGLSAGQGGSAYLSWAVIQSAGFHNWKCRTPRTTYYRHKRILLEAGFSWADLSVGKVVPLRRRRLDLGQPVRSWAELRAVA